MNRLFHPTPIYTATNSKQTAITTLSRRKKTPEYAALLGDGSREIKEKQTEGESERESTH